MREENELNIELTAQQSEIESTISSVDLPESLVDQNVLMYQAGWAAAMAEANRSTDKNLTLRESKFSAWPVIATTFAASTVVCLALLMRGPDAGSANVSSGSVANVEADIEPSDDPASVASNPPSVVEESKIVDASTSQFALVKLFGISTNQIVQHREARIQKLLAETASPPRGLAAIDGDEDLEPRVPLTPRSSFPLSL